MTLPQTQTPMIGESPATGSTPVIVVMAVFRPDPAHLAAQIASIAAQSHRNIRLVAVIADTISGDLVRDCVDEAGGLPLRLVETGLSLDAVRAFEAGLGEAVRLADAESGPEPLIALSDQDDIWRPERLARGIEALTSSGADLVHSDCQLVAADGTTPLQSSMFRFERRLKNPGLRGLLYRNNITGMTVLMRTRLARLSLPFPPQSGVHFYHDLWLGVLAAATGGVSFIDEALVDYRQHDSNAIGAVDRQAGWLRSGARRLPNAMWLRREAASYGLARYLGHSAQNRLVEATVDGRLSPGGAKTRALRPFLRRTRGAGWHLWDAVKLTLRGHLGLARIATGFAVVSAGRVVWTLREALGPGLNTAIDGFDTRLYSLSPGVSPTPPALPDHAKKTGKTDRWDALVDLRKRAQWQPEFNADAPSLTVLVPTLNPAETFAGIVTALDIGLGLAARGAQVRFVATDLPISSPGASRSFLLRRLSHEAAANGAEERVSFHCGISEETIPAHPDDTFMATAWWTAHVVHALIAEHGYRTSRFHYLIQDFEPNFYAWGPEFADAMASYEFDFKPVFNSTLLRDYFANQGFGFADESALAFQPAIDVARYAKGKRPAKDGPRRLALYGRPEVDRNMFPTAIEALALFIEAEKLGPEQITLHSIGLVHPDVQLPRGLTLESKGKLPWDDYPDYLLGSDIGLSLMYSPHPSHPPIEMAASGMRVVTNGFGPKDLGVLSDAITSTAPTATALAEALSASWHAGPVAKSARQINLAHLGQAPDRMIDRLAEDFGITVPQPDIRRGDKRRIILHIGSPKCGSTFLQSALLQSRDALADVGIVYPHDGGLHPGNAGDIADLDSDTLEQWFGGNAHTVLLSHEDLYPMPTRGQALADLAKAADIDVQLLVFLRPFNEFLYGDYSQFMKQNFEQYLTTRQPYNGQSFEDFVHHRAKLLRPSNFLRGWQKIIGQGAPILARHTDIRDTMAELLGPDAPINWNVHRDRTNPSLRMEDCERLAKLIEDPEVSEDDARTAFREAFHKTNLPDEGRSAKRTDWIEAQFSKQVHELLNHFGYDNRPTAKVSSPAPAASIVDGAK